MDRAVQKPPALTFDEASMERSKDFVKALQELKNLRPQLYSAAEYCEKSFLQSDQKQMVLDNLKDYVVQALVNAVDHLGTVAYKLTDIREEHMLDASTMELKIACLNQKLLTCQAYTEKDDLMKHQLVAIIPEHHKHYTLPNSVNKKVLVTPHVQTDPRRNVQPKPRLSPSGTPAAKTLSWHLASETEPSMKETLHSFISADESKGSRKLYGAFNCIENAEERNRKKSTAAYPQSPNLRPLPMVHVQTLAASQEDAPGGSKPASPFRSFQKQSQLVLRLGARACFRLSLSSKR